MKFVANPGPYQRSDKHTGKIMRDLLIGLAVVWLAAIIYNFTIGVEYGVKAILMVVVAVVATALADVAVAAIRYDSKNGPMGKYILKQIQVNYSAVTAVIFALTLPIGTSYYVIIIGALFATLIGKYVFGGFGHNIFNPAAIGRIFVSLTFGASLVPHLGNASDVPTLIAGSTLTSAFANASGIKWIADGLANVSLGQIWLGTYSGALGEPFAALILLIAIVFVIRGVINWRAPAFYLGTVALTSVVIALFTGLNPLTYPLYQLGLGGLMFGAVFMITDPVSGPTSMSGKALVGVIAGFFTVLIRIQGNLPEGVVFSLAIANMISPFIDRVTTGLTNKNLGTKWAVVSVGIALTMGVNGGLSFANKNAPSSEEPSSEEPPVEVFATKQGSAQYIGWEDEADLHAMTVDVGLDKFYNIVQVEWEEAPTTTGYENAWNNNIDAVLDYYTSLSVKEFNALPGAPAEGLKAGITNSMTRLYLAMKDALKDIDVYTGTATSAVPAAEDHYGSQTINVDVYVEAGLISTVAISGDTTTGGNFANLWDNKLDAVLDFYQGMAVADFLILNAPPVELTSIVAGVTISYDRLYDAMKNALATYGGGE